MKELFPGFYPTSSDKIDLTAPTTLVAFDANVLLNLYRYPTSASEDILKLMDGLGDKVWLPYHAALEYQRNRLPVIAEQKKRFREARTIVEKGIASVEGELAKLQLIKRHSTIDIKKLQSDLLSAKTTFFTLLDEKEAAQRDVTDEDATRKRLETIFAGRIGAAPTEPWLKDIEKDAQVRYAAKRPPGFCDLSKQGETFTHQGLLYRRELGDLILWRPLLAHAKEKASTQLVFITDDEKDDWWLTIESGGPKRIGPRPELVEEAKSDSGVGSFFMLTSERFTPIFAELLKIKLRVNTIAQVADVKATLSEPVAVRCPECGAPANVQLGRQTGSSAFRFCDACGNRFHIHRAADGTAFTKSWGSSEKPKPTDVWIKTHRVEAVCPNCEGIVPANIRDDQETAERFCMNCSTRLTISKTGEVLKDEPSSVLKASQVSGTNHLTFLTCPQCPQVAPVRAIWGNGVVARAVCPSCSSLIEGMLPPE